MREWLYLVVDPLGRKQSGELEARDERQVIEILRKRDVTILEITPVKEKHWIFLLFQPVKGTALALFIRQLGVMLTAGIPMAMALRSLVPAHPPRFKKAIEKLCIDVESGFSLSQAMRKAPEFFNNFMVGSVRIGEHSGTLDRALSECADFYEREYTYARKLKAALLYPCFLFGASGLLVFFIFTFMIPRFVGMFVDLQVELPATTQFLVSSAAFVETYGMVTFCTLAGPLAAFTYIFYHWSKTGSGRMALERTILRVPWYGQQVRYRMLSQYFRAFSTLLASGVTVESSLRLLEKSLERETLRRTVKHQLQEVRKGRPFTAAINVYKVFPPMALEMITVGEETGRVDDMMRRMTAFYDEEMVRGLATLSKLVEPVVLCGLGSIVAFLLLAAFQPIYQLAGSF